MNEVWKSIEGYSGLYQVSNIGRVKSLRFSKERILKQSPTGPKRLQYYAVNLCEYGEHKMYIIHRLVAVYFVPNPGKKLMVNHIDNDQKNNRYTNLEWCTPRENMTHGYTFKKTSSKYTGVYWYKYSNKWKASIHINGKAKHIGTFTSEIEASNAYQTELNKITI